MRVIDSDLEYRITEYILKHLEGCDIIDRTSLVEEDIDFFKDVVDSIQEDIALEFTNEISNAMNIPYEDAANIITPEYIGRILRMKYE